MILFSNGLQRYKLFLKPKTFQKIFFIFFQNHFSSLSFWPNLNAFLLKRCKDRTTFYSVQAFSKDIFQKIFFYETNNKIKFCQNCDSNGINYELVNVKRTLFLIFAVSLNQIFFHLFEKFINYNPPLSNETTFRTIIDHTFYF